MLSLMFTSRWSWNSEITEGSSSVIHLPVELEVDHITEGSSSVIRRWITEGSSSVIHLLVHPLGNGC